MAIDRLAVVEAQMLIRRPVPEVFEAFINPHITTRFWFTKKTITKTPTLNRPLLETAG